MVLADTLYGVVSERFDSAMVIKCLFQKSVPGIKSIARVHCGAITTLTSIGREKYGAEVTSRSAPALA